MQTWYLSSDGLALEKMSLFAFDPELEQKLNDIDEFIRSQCGDDLTDGFDQSEWLLPSQAGDAPLQHSSWNVKGRSGNLVHIRHLRKNGLPFGQERGAYISLTISKYVINSYELSSEFLCSQRSALTIFYKFRLLLAKTVDFSLQNDYFVK